MKQDVLEAVGSKDRAAVSAGRTLADQAYEKLSGMIRRRQLRSGEMLVELQLAEQLGVSRTPLREALQRLEGDGLLGKSVNRSYIVREVGIKEYLRSLKVRQILEPESAALAAGHVSAAAISSARRNLARASDLQPYDMLAHYRSDDEVHDLFIRNCRNDVMTDILLSLRITTQLFEIETLSERLEPDAREHERILDALDAGDARKARRAVAAHIRSLYAFALQTIG